MAAALGVDRLIEYYQRQIGYLEKKKLKGETDLKAKPSTPQDQARMRVFRHNSYRGHAAMMRANLNGMIASDSTSQETKHLARSILGLISKLENSLQIRIDP